MRDIERDLSFEVNLNTLAKSIYSESIEMGFKSNDYVKLMNEIIDMTINNRDISQHLKKSIEEGDDKISDLPVTTKNLKIRHFDPKIDNKYVAKWFEDENNKLFFLSTTSKQDLDLENISSNEKNIFATITLGDKKPIGLLAILNIDKKHKKGEMRKMIGDISERGKGYAKEATEVWVKYCIESLGLNKIFIYTIETNIKNISLNRQIGFKVEGLFKKECIIDNIEHDVLRMAYFKWFFYIKFMNLTILI